MKIAIGQCAAHHHLPDCCVSRCANRQGCAWSSGCRDASKRTTGEDHHRSSRLAEPPSHGVVIMQYRTENLHIARVFGPAALAVSPRIGHMHVVVEDATWHWADAGGNPVIIKGASRRGFAAGIVNWIVLIVAEAPHESPDAR